MLSLILAAAEEAETSEAPFLVAGGALAAFAVLVSVVGFTRPDFPRSAGAARGVMALGAALVVVTLVTAVAVS